MGLDGIPDWEAAEKIWKVVPPILLILGTLGNVLTIVVLMRGKTRRSSTAIYLTALACSDLLVLYTGLLRQWIKYMYDIDVRHLSVAGCKIHVYLVYSGTQLSSWLLVAVTSERFVGVWCPHKVKMGCTPVTAGGVVGVICFVIGALNVHWLYGKGDLEYTFQNQTRVAKCASLFDDYNNFLKFHWPWVDLCMFCLLPFTILIIENSAIIIKVIKSHAKARTQIAPAKSGGEQKKPSSKRSQLTAMLLTINAVFFVCVTPISIYLIGQTYWIKDIKTWEQYAHMMLWWAIVNTLMYINHSINFIMYFLSGTRFRQEVKALFCGGKAGALFGLTMANTTRVAPTNTDVSQIEQTAFTKTKSEQNATVQNGQVESIA